MSDTFRRTPVSQFWSITIYSLKTSGFFLNSSRLTLGSLDKELRKNADGSVDIYIGPKPPAGQHSNWRGFGSEVLLADSRRKGKRTPEPPR